MPLTARAADWFLLCNCLGSSHVPVGQGRLFWYSPWEMLRLSFPGGDEILILQCQFCLQLSDVCFCLPFTGLETISTESGQVITTVGKYNSQENKWF